MYESERNKGWIKSFRVWQSSQIINKDHFRFALWQHLNLMASHQFREVEFDGKIYTLKPGELITGRKSLSKISKIDESRIQRILKRFEKSGLIYQKTTNRNRLIGIISWEKDQHTERQIEQQNTTETSTNKTISNDYRPRAELQPYYFKHRKRTTKEQQLNINKNYKNLNNEKNKQLSLQKSQRNSVEIENKEINKPQIFPYDNKIEKMDIEEQVAKLFEIWNREVYFKEYEKVINLINQYSIKVIWSVFNETKQNSTLEKNCCNIVYVGEILKMKNSKKDK